MMYSTKKKILLIKKYNQSQFSISFVDKLTKTVSLLSPLATTSSNGNACQIKLSNELN